MKIRIWALAIRSDYDVTTDVFATEYEAEQHAIANLFWYDEPDELLEHGLEAAAMGAFPIAMIERFCMDDGLSYFDDWSGDIVAHVIDCADVEILSDLPLTKG